MTTVRRWSILAIVSSALFLITVDMTVLYTALPRLTHDLEASASEKLWIVNVYSLLMAGLLPAFGTLGDHLGYKRLFITGLAVFGAASVMAAYAPLTYVLIAARSLLAVGAAMMMPATLSIIRVTFPDERERSLAIGVWASVSSGGAGIGPLIGGFLLEHFWWGSVFLINVPVVLLALLFAISVIPALKGQVNKQWDVIGSVQVVIGLVAVVYAVKELGRRGGEYEAALAAVILGMAALVLFVCRQKRRLNPLIDFALFSDQRFLYGTVTAMVSTFALVGSQLVFTQHFQLVRGFSPLRSSLFTLSLPVASFFSGSLIGLVLNRDNTLLVQWRSLLIAGAGLGSFLVCYDASAAGEIGSLTIMGAGIGAAMTAASSAIMNNAPAEKAGMAASVEEVSFELGSAVGVAILGSLSSFVYTAVLSLPTGLDVAPAVYDSLDEAMLVAEALPAETAAILVKMAQAAFTQSFMVVIAAAAGVLLLSSLGIAMASRRFNAKHRQ